MTWAELKELVDNMPKKDMQKEVVAITTDGMALRIIGHRADEDFGRECLCLGLHVSDLMR